MIRYRATITADKYPWTVTVEASNWATGTARIVRAWMKRFKGSRATDLTIKIVKVGTVGKDVS